MRFRLVKVDDVELDEATLGFAVEIARGGSGEVRLELATRQRGARPPAVSSMRYAGRSLVLTAYRTAAIAIDEFRTRVATLFAPGQHRLEAETSGRDRVEAMVVVERIAWREQSDLDMRIEAQMQDVAWRSVTTRSTSAPSTANVNGNLPAYPVIRIPTTSAATATWRRYAITDRFGQGLAGYPVKLPVAPPAQDTVVLVNGLAVPFLVASGGLWVRVDVPPGGTTLVDVVTSAAIENRETADTLDLGGLWPASSNTVWHYHQIRAIDAPLAGTGTWRLTRTYAHSGERGYRFGGVERNGRVHLALVSRDAPLEGSGLPNLLDDYDSVALVTGVPIAHISLDWTVRSRAWEKEAYAWSDGYGVAVLRYRRHGDPEWHDRRRMPVSCTWTPGYWVVRYRPYYWWWWNRWYWYLTTDYYYDYLLREWVYVKTTPYPAVIEISPHRYVVVYRVFVTYFPQEGFAPPFTTVDTMQVSVPVAASFVGERVVSVALALEPYWVREKLLKVYKFHRTDENGNVTERWQYERHGDSWVELELGGWVTVTLDAGSVPQISLVHERTAYVYNGHVRSERTKQEITLARVIADGALVLDCDRRVVEIEDGELFAAWRIAFSDPVDWIRLEPGANALAGLAASVAWQERWLE
jgi:hypothetical protein